MTSATTSFLHYLPRSDSFTRSLRFSLSGNQLSSLPPEIAQLSALTSLSLSNNQLSSLPSEIAQLSALTSLSLSSNQLSSLPPEIAQLSALTSLSLSSNQLSSLPPEITQLNALTSLFLSGNQLSSLPPEIAQLNALTSLNLSGNQLSSLPPEITQLNALTSLDLSGNQLSSLPPEITQLNALTSLFLSGNQLSSLPPEIAQLNALTSLFLKNNQLSSLPPEIAQLNALTSLDLSGNQLSSLPPEITQLNALTSLDLSGNQLSSLPPEIAQLNALTWLDLSGNQLSSLPPEIAQLTSIKTLDLAGNPLSTLPPEVNALKLEFTWEKHFYSPGFNLYGNPLQLPPAEIAQKGDQAVRAYFDELAPTPLREVKLIMVGDGGAGKTSLMRRMLGQAFDEHERQTHGINIQPWDASCPGGDTIRVNIWDFGGQEIMHATHQFFLSHRSLYLLVLDGRREEKTEYWLKHIESFGQDSPVFVILNKIDENPAHEVNRVALVKKYPHIQGFFRISCATDEGIDKAKDALLARLPQLDMVQTYWPERWLKVKKALENNRKPFLDFDQYRRLCLGEGIAEESVREILVAFLHDLGVAIHFSDFKLEDTYVLDPLWVTTAVYRIINNPKIVHESGVLALKEMKHILRKTKPDDFTYPVSKHPYIINIMQKFELCYELPGDRVLVPDLLPVQEPAIDFDADGALRCRVTYEFLPRTVMPRFIVKRHTQIDGGLQWRTGVVLARGDGQARAVIRADYEERFIEIQVNGPLRRDFYAVIRDALRDINDGFKSNVIRETVACNCDQCREADQPHFHDYPKLLRFFAKEHRHWPCPVSEEMISNAQLLGDVLGAKEEDLVETIRAVREAIERGDPPEKIKDKIARFTSISGVTALEIGKWIFSALS